MAFYFLVIFVALSIVWRRRARPQLRSVTNPENEEIWGDEADRIRLENEIAELPLDHREDLLKQGFACYQKYSTFQAYSQEYMEDLVKYLNAQGVIATYYFNQSLPLGSASILLPQGMFELYVHRDQFAAADLLIKGRGLPS